MTNLALRWAILIGSLAWPACLCAWTRSRALAQGEHGLESWSAYREIHRACGLIALSGWWALWDSGAGFATAWAALFWILPLALLTISELLAYSGSRRIRNLRWSRLQIARQAFWATVRYTLPGLLVAAGFSRIYRGSFAGLAWLGAALVVAIIGRVGLFAALGLNPHRARTGELRNRAFAMARRMNVELREVNIIPQGKAHLATGCAGARGSISLTDNLPQLLDRDEVDSVLAHELAHLKLRHIRRRMLESGALYLGVVAAVFAWPAHFPLLRPALDVAVFLAPILILASASRRRERAADQAGAAFLGDPRPGIRALAKLDRAHHTPARTGWLAEIFASHPGLERRANAMAASAGLPRALSAQILAEVFPPVTPAHRHNP